jgi:hypothetical protein
LISHPWTKYENPFLLITNANPPRFDTGSMLGRLQTTLFGC